MARSFTLQERLHGGGSAGEPVDAAVLDRWRTAVEPAGTAWFERRLRWDGLTGPVHLARAEDVLASDPGHGIPWPEVLEELSRAAPRCLDPRAVDPSPVRAAEPVAFEELLLPTVVVGRRRLLRRVGRQGARGVLPTDVMTVAAYLDLERSLLEQVSWLAEEVLAAEFQAGTGVGSALVAAFGHASAAAPGRARYTAFVRRLLQTGWLPLLDRYPVLGRLLATCVALWVDATAELVERLRSDHGRLRRVFGLRPGARAATFDTALGDRHRGGRAVTGVVFDDGTRLLHKPKPLAAEAALSDLITWSNAAGATPPLQVTRVLDRGTYGWTEHVDAGPCRTTEEVDRFFTRGGMLLALLHVLRATDCHYENLVAAGDQPVLVDAETLLYAEPRPLDLGDRAPDGETLSERMLGASVLRVGLLPQWRVHGGSAYDTSGLAATSAPPDGDEQTDSTWVDMGTDAMRRVRRPPRPRPLGHVVRLDDRPQSVLDHRTELVAGFRSMYRLLASRRAELLAPSGPLEPLRRCPTRFIHRATRFYGAFLSSCRDPDLLRSGLDLGLHLEQLARAYLPCRDRPPLWPLFAEEVRALVQLDVPVLDARPDTCDLRGAAGTDLPGVLTRPAYDTVREQLLLLGERDLAQQVRVVEASLSARAARERPPVPHPPLTTSPEPATDVDLLAAATGIGSAIAAAALTDGPGSVNWIGLQYLDDGDCHQVDVLDDFLYDGTAGIAVFFAALFRATGDAQWHDLALAALAGPRRRIRTADPSSRRLTARLRGIGAGSGLGGLVYGLTAVARLLGPGPAADEALDEATALAGWLDAATVAEAPRLDVLAGTAGALLSLLALHATTGDRKVLERAIGCGEHLRHFPATGREPGDDHHHGGRLTGLAHGSAGMALALARLSAATSEPAFFDAALEHLEFERSLFDPGHGGWPDLRPRPSAAGRWPVKWCHGAAGITLSRLGILPFADGPDIRAEIAAGLESTRRHLLDGPDSLCCGAMGRIDVLAVAADVLGEPAVRVTARRGAAAVLGARSHHRAFRLIPDDGVLRPGLFQGSAGIGYELLRLRDPGLPSVLLWD